MNPLKFYRVSQSQLSIARYYGGITYNGSSYTYNPVDDTLTRDDVVKADMRSKKQIEREKKLWERERRLGPIGGRKGLGLSKELQQQ